MPSTGLLAATFAAGGAEGVRLLCSSPGSLASLGISPALDLPALVSVVPVLWQGRGKAVAGSTGWADLERLPARLRISRPMTCTSRNTLASCSRQHTIAGRSSPKHTASSVSYVHRDESPVWGHPSQDSASTPPHLAERLSCPGSCCESYHLQP